jgi:hypothetical protein
MEKGKKKTGRPSKYKPEYDEQAAKLCLLGATNDDLAKFFNVAVSTVNKWIAEIPKFSDAIKANREDADHDVAQSLYQAALNGNTTAQIFWLKNRQARRWREKQEIDHRSEDGSMTPRRIEIVAPKE